MALTINVLFSVLVETGGLNLPIGNWFGVLAGVLGDEKAKNLGGYLEADSSASLRNDNKKRQPQEQLQPQIPFGNDNKNSQQQLQPRPRPRRLLLAEEAEFAGGAVGAEVVGEVEGGSGAGGYGGVGAEAAEAEEA
jgi:hypothetical protein